MVVASVNIFCRKLGTGCGNATMTLKEVSAGLPTGAALATSNAIDSTGWTTAAGGEEVQFVFNTPATLKASTQYAFELFGTAGNVSNGGRLQTDAAGSYTGGTAFQAGGIDTTDDAWFEINGGGKFLLIKMSDGSTWQAVLIKTP